MEQMEKDMMSLLINPKNKFLTRIFDFVPIKVKQNKSLKLAQEMRQDGNRIYTSCRSQEDYLIVYSKYAESIAYAPLNSREMALAYSNLSAVLLRLERYLECLQAIDCCLNLDYPEESKFKIYLRKIECLKILDMLYKAMKCCRETLAWIEKNVTEGEERVDMMKKLSDCYRKEVKVKKRFSEEEINLIWNNFSIQTFNQEVPGASSAISLQYTESRGRHFIATRDIRPGEILLNLKGPSVLVCLKDKRYQCCWECHKFMGNCIPCDCCKNVIFCSVECKEKAWKEYHQAECQLLNHLLNLQNLSDQMITVIIKAFRILFLAIKEYGTIRRLKEAVRELDQPTIDPRTRGFTDGQLQEDKYLGFYAMKYYDNVSCAMPLAAGTIYKVATETNLLGKRFKPVWKRLNKDKDFVFAAALFARHINILSGNTIQIGHNCKNINSITGSCLSITGNIFNHSCYGNVFCHSTKPYRAIAILPIKQGEEVTVNYLGWNDLTISDRQSIFRSKYHFICNCIACANKWPLPSEYPSVNKLSRSVTYTLMTTGTMIICYNVLKYKDIALIPHNGNYKSMLLVLEKLFKILGELVANVPLPCLEVVHIQDTLMLFCVNLRSAYF